MPRVAAIRLALCLIAISSCFLGLEARGTEAGHNSSADERIILTVGRSVVLDRTEDIRRVAIADEQVADAIVVSPADSGASRSAFRDVRLADVGSKGGPF